jgi:DNA-binding MarR family transcriptional regulator
VLKIFVNELFLKERFFPKMAECPKPKNNKKLNPDKALSSSSVSSGNENYSEATCGTSVPKNSYELRVLQSLRRIIRAVEIHSRKLAQNYQITGPQLVCLLVLLEEGPLLGTRLARKVYLSPSTVVGIVDRLEEKGLATRDRSPSDRRQVQVSITDKGRKVVAQVPSPLQDKFSDALKNLPELEQVSIALALEKVVELMEADRIDASPVLQTGPIST